jgi:hypothetical protein
MAKTASTGEQRKNRLTPKKRKKGLFAHFSPKKAQIRGF